MAITSEEINYLVYRYLQESGVVPALEQRASPTLCALLDDKPPRGRCLVL